jgi:hypothetical protein
MKPFHASLIVYRFPDNISSIPVCTRAYKQFRVSEAARILGSGCLRAVPENKGGPTQVGRQKHLHPFQPGQLEQLQLQYAWRLFVVSHMARPSFGLG